MRSAQDRLDYEAGWTQFVDSLEEFWTRFYDEGKKTFSSFQPWAGALDAQRKADDLLKYLYQARHQSQHGRIEIQWGEPRLLIARDFSGHIRGLKVFNDGTYEIDSTPLQPALPDAVVENAPGDPMLPVIENKRFRQTFNPPDAFDGKPLQDSAPATVAQLGLDYYKSVLADAFRKFGSEMA